ncbi:MAG: cation:proton antiporter [Thiobacillus sp.]
MTQPFDEFALLLIITTVLGAIAVRLRQPILIAYIAVGILLGPAGFSLVSAHDQIDLLAQIGITVLLFVVGLKLDLRHIRHIGPVALATGLGQLSFTIVFGFFIILALGKGWLEALYVAVALTFSSTIIIVKLLSGISDEQIHQYRARAREDALNSMAQFADQLSIPAGQLTRLAVHGAPTLRILEHEQSLDVDLIAMGKHGQSTLEELLLGSVTKHVLAYSSSDVLIAGHPA